jgi:hypothetical protein
MNTEIHNDTGPSPEYLARLRELERYLPVMTRFEQDQLIHLQRTDWPEETLIKWSGKLAERNALRADIQRRAYARQPALRPDK